jgi:hypothetical protein
MISGTHPGIELEGEGVTLDALRLADSSPAPGEYPITEEIPGELEAIASIRCRWVVLGSSRIAALRTCSQEMG